MAARGGIEGVSPTAGLANGQDEGGCRQDRKPHVPYRCRECERLAQSGIDHMKFECTKRGGQWFRDMSETRLMQIEMRRN
jgi:hypothetical protein